MKLLRAAGMLFAVASIAAAYQAKAVTYTDATGENFTTAGGGILDISSVEVNNDASDIIFKINLTGDPTATDWGKYMIGLDTVPGGDAASNGWARPIALTLGMDYWLGSWVDGGNGVQVWQYAGSWSQTGGAGPFAGGPAMPGLAITKDSSSVTITVPLSGLGLSVGNVILFDVYTSGGGGGDSAVDSLANPNQSISDWPGPYSSSRSVLFTVIPEPSTLVLVGLGALAVMGWMFRRRA